MIHLVLLTGFLGSGKTTLMTALLDVYQDKKVGVIVNEFGQVNIDAVLIKRKGITIAELSNGSIFCACIKEHFLSSLIEMSKQDIDYLFIEASGLADPANMAQILKTIGPKTSRPYDYKGAICVIDAENFLNLYELLPALHHQVEYSSAIIINKADLVQEAVIEAICDQVSGINTTAEIVVTSYCKADIKAMVERLSPVNKEPGESTNTVESRPKTFILRGEENLNLKGLEALVKEIAGTAYRIKGFARTEQGNKEISAVGENICFNPWSEEVKETEIVVISSVGIKMLSILTAAIEKHLKGKIHF